MKWSATACRRFSTFFEKPFVSLVKRRIPMRIVRFCRSTKLVEMCCCFGLPTIEIARAPIHSAGLYRASDSQSLTHNVIARETWNERSRRNRL